MWEAEMLRKDDVGHGELMHQIEVSSKADQSARVELTTTSLFLSHIR